MAKSAYNLLWISENQIPEKALENIQNITRQNPNSDIRLWFDSKRLSLDQIPNISLLDLRTIPEYDGNPLFNESVPILDPDVNKDSVVWKQVDAAKILICLQGEYDKVFYSDLDIINLQIDSESVQKILNENGVIVGGNIVKGRVGYENQLFGFDKSRRESFRSLYEDTIHNSALGENGYFTFTKFVENELGLWQRIDTREIIFEPKYINHIDSLKEMYKRARERSRNSGEGEQ